MNKQMKSDKLYMDIAERVALESTARKLQVGAILVKDDQIVIGYNGTRSGADNNCEELTVANVSHPTHPNVTISTFGNIYLGDIELIPYQIKDGRLFVDIHEFSYQVVILVAQTFFSPFFNLPIYKYELIDGDLLNCRLDNIKLIDPNGLTILNVDYLKTHEHVLHAETNLASKVMQSQIDSTDSTVYVTHSCCIDCAKIMYQSGVTRLVYKHNYKSNTGIKYLIDAGVEVVQI